MSVQEKYFQATQLLKDRVAANLVQSNSTSKLNLNKEELERVIAIVSSTIEQVAIQTAELLEG